MLWLRLLVSFVMCTFYKYFFIKTKKTILILRDLKFLLDTDLKTILLDYQNNFVGTLKIINKSKCTRNHGIYHLNQLNPICCFNYINCSTHLRVWLLLALLFSDYCFKFWESFKIFLKIINNVATCFDILAISLSVLYNYFDSSTKLLFWSVSS